MGTMPIFCKEHPGKKNIIIRPWYNHPAVSMWRGFELSLCEYGISTCLEWKNRKYKDTLLNKFSKIFKQVSKNYYVDKGDDHFDPFWLGDKDFHASHRSNLLRKDPVWYEQFNWTEPDNLPYIWPVQK